jgi:hypothetical protein
MPGITVKRAVQLQAIVTDQLKEELVAELQEAADTTQQRIDQIEFQSRRYLAEVQKADLSKAMSLRQQIEAEKQKHELLKKEFLDKITEVQSLDLGAEFPRGTLEGLVELKEGDNLEAKLAGAEVVIKDGIVIEVRER